MLYKRARARTHAQAIFSPFALDLWGGVVGLLFLTAVLMNLIGLADDSVEGERVPAASADSSATDADAVDKKEDERRTLLTVLIDCGSAVLYSTYHTLAMYVPPRSTTSSAMTRARVCTCVLTHSRAVNHSVTYARILIAIFSVTMLMLHATAFLGGKPTNGYLGPG